MSKSGSGIGIGGLIFWAFIAYTFFGGDDDEDKKVIDVEVKPKVEISEELKQKADKALEKAKGAIEVAKEKLNEVSKEKTEEQIESPPEEEIKQEPEDKQEPKKKEEFKPI